MNDKLNIQNNNLYLKLGNKFFLLGTFFLPSALPISAIFLFASLLISYSQKQIIYLKDKWNYPIFIAIGIILFSSLNVSFLNQPAILKNYNNSDIWINLFNWIPIFIFFWGFQTYLETYKQRVDFSRFLVYSSIPVILSIILQKFFYIYGKKRIP